MTKNLRNTITILVLSFLLIGTHQSFGQFKRGNSLTGQKFKVHKKPIKKRPLNYINSIKFIGGVSYLSYSGDLCSGFECMKFNYGGIIGGQYRVNERFAIQLEGQMFKVEASDGKENLTSRNQSFRSQNFYLNTKLTVDLFKYNKMYRRRHTLAPYGYVGLGILFFNPQGQNRDGSWSNLRPVQTEGTAYNSYTFAVPYGIGVRIKVNPILDVSVESGYIWTFTDYLDDVSTTYKNTNGVNEEELFLMDKRPGRDGTTEYLIDQSDYNSKYAATGLKRGNSQKNDGVFFFNVKVDYTLKVTKQSYNMNSNTSKFRIIRNLKKRG